MSARASKALTTRQGLRRFPGVAMDDDTFQPFQMPPLADINPLAIMSLDEAAELVQRTPGAIRVWAHRGRITPIDLGDGGPLVYHQADIATAEKWIRDHGGPRHKRTNQAA